MMSMNSVISLNSHVVNVADDKNGLSLHHMAPNLGKKVSTVAHSVFKLLITTVTFPLRFVGSKTWSIPGIVIRTPVILFRRILFKEPITKTKFFGSGYHSKNGEALSKEGAKEILRYATISLVPFRNESEKWSEPFGAKIVSPTSLDIDLAKVPGKIETDSHAFIDKECFFKTLVLEDEHEMIVTFSPLHSHWHDYNDSNVAQKKYYKNLLSVLSCYLGGMPRAYRQADALIEQLKGIAEKKNKKIVVTGQSWSAAIASYVSLKHEIKGFCFNAVQLGAGIQKDLGSEKLAKADQYLTQVSIERDLVSQLPGVGVFDRFLSALGVRIPGNFGKRFLVPTAFDSIRASHDYPVKSLMAYIGYDKETKANELNAQDIIKSN